tara:strand:+ start:22237 stop:23487 length:1251 start_codon:yes stop_codon:yes gene_type:complete
MSSSAQQVKKNSSIFNPFPGIVASSEMAAAVAAPPYDVVSRVEACDVAMDNPHSFLRVSRAEIELPIEIDAYDKAVYERAALNFNRLINSNILVADTSPAYYIWRLSADEYEQTGVVVAASIDAYKSGYIMRHEFTRPEKELDRVYHIKALSAATGPTLLTHKPDSQLCDYIKLLTDQGPIIDITGPNNVSHKIWRISALESINSLQKILNKLPGCYIADGHHRTAAASRLSEGRDSGGGSFLGVLFPSDQLNILDYNRVIRDLNGLSGNDFLRELELDFIVKKLKEPKRPKKARSFTLYIEKKWYSLELRSESIVPKDPVNSLDVSILSTKILEPIIDLYEPRTNQRIDFVGGARGLEGLKSYVDKNNWSVAFALFPTSIDDLIKVADCGEVMPPKSTWFEPKLLDGLISLAIKS